MSEANHSVEVDLTDDEQAVEEPEAKGEPDVVDAEPEPEQSTQERVSEMATKQRQRLLKSADGSTELERAENALDEATRLYKGHAQSMEQAKQQLQKTRGSIDELGDTIERVEGVPAGVQVIQTLAGGISVEVPASAESVETLDGETVDTDAGDVFDREDLVEQIEDHREALGEKSQRLEERIESMELELQAVQTAASDIRNHREMLADSQ